MCTGRPIAQHRFIHQEFAESLADAPASGSEIGKTRWEVPYLEPDEEAWRKHRETLDAHLPFRDFELARPAPTVASVTCLSPGCRFLTIPAASSGYRGVGRHITERRLAEEALRAMQAELAHANRVTTMGELSASIAHEVNQPIAATVANAQAALRWPARPTARSRRGSRLPQPYRRGRQARRQRHRGIRAFIHKVPPRKDRFDLNEAILEMVTLTRSEVLNHGILLQTELTPGLPRVDGDRTQLQQVILNLILNATEAMSGIHEGDARAADQHGEGGRGRRARSRCAIPARAWTLRIPSAFSRLSTRRSPKGMGMGLAICRSMVEAHGGRMWASANEPRGAVFQFTLPLERDESIPARLVRPNPAA
jgi:signal transduction histidine kinase